MPEGEFDVNDIERRMEGAITALKSEFAGLRTGRASATMLDPIVVEAYGQKMPINQVGTVNVPDSRLLTVQVWDKGQVAFVEKALRESGLGINPVVEGQVIRIPIPELNEERRAELAKVAGKYAEQARVAVRNVRRDGMDKLKRLEKSGDMSEDEHKRYGGDVQSLTDKYVATVDDVAGAKEAEIMKV